jgi:hypothetical protein
LEKIVATKLTNHLELNKLIYEHQYGFLRNKSTEHNLIHVINNISSALNENKYCIGVFLDLKKAFDTCNHQILLGKLNKLGINGPALEWFKSYLENRQQITDINNHFSEMATINISVLQGTILGPLLFLCYINDLPLSTNLLTFLFADDTTCIDTDSHLPSLINRVNAELQKLANWFRNNKMAVNTSKTKFILFHSKGKQINIDPNSIVFNNNEIGYPNNPELITPIDRIYSKNPNKKDRYFKLLGVLLDENLTFNDNTDYLCNKLAKSIFIINQAKNFLSPKALKTLYFSLVHSHLLYCINITSCTSQSNINRITKLQKKAIRIISNVNSTAHTEPLFRNLNILPFDKLITQGRLHLMHSIMNNYCPDSFLNIFQTNATRNNGRLLRNDSELILPQHRIELFKKMPLYTLPHLWNNLKIELKAQRNKTTFRIALQYDLLNPPDE